MSVSPQSVRPTYVRQSTSCHSTFSLSLHFLSVSPIPVGDFLRCSTGCSSNCLRTVLSVTALPVQATSCSSHFLSVSPIPVSNFLQTVHVVQVQATAFIRPCSSNCLHSALFKQLQYLQTALFKQLLYLHEALFKRLPAYSSVQAFTFQKPCSSDCLNYSPIQETALIKPCSSNRLHKVLFKQLPLLTLVQATAFIKPDSSDLHEALFERLPSYSPVSATLWSQVDFHKAVFLSAITVHVTVG